MVLSTYDGGDCFYRTRSPCCFLLCSTFVGQSLSLWSLLLLLLLPLVPSFPSSCCREGQTSQRNQAPFVRTFVCVRENVSSRLPPSNIVAFLSITECMGGALRCLFSSLVSCRVASLRLLVLSRRQEICEARSWFQAPVHVNEPLLFTWRLNARVQVLLLMRLVYRYCCCELRWRWNHIEFILRLPLRPHHHRLQRLGEDFLFFLPEEDRTGQDRTGQDRTGQGRILGLVCPAVEREG